MVDTFPVAFQSSSQPCEPMVTCCSQNEIALEFGGQSRGATVSSPSSFCWTVMVALQETLAFTFHMNDALHGPD